MGKKILKKSVFKLKCAKCGNERKPGTLMYCERVIDENGIKHIHTCKQCPQNKANGRPVELPMREWML